MTYRTNNDNPIAIRRRKATMTQTELAARVCVIQKTVSKWECGEESPSGRHLSVLAEIFGVTAGRLLNELLTWREKQSGGNHA